MRRFGQKITVVMLLAGLISLPLGSVFGAVPGQSNPHCIMSISPGAAAPDAKDHCKHSTECKHCVTCNACAQCIGNAAVGQGGSGMQSGADWQFDNYSSSFLSIYPPIDSPPPRLG